MPVTYTNRKGHTYYLCQGVTKTGKSRYYFAREPRGEPVEDRRKRQWSRLSEKRPLRGREIYVVCDLFQSRICGMKGS